MITIEIHNGQKPKQVLVIAKQNGKQLLKSPMQCKTMTKKQIEQTSEEGFKSL